VIPVAPCRRERQRASSKFRWERSARGKCVPRRTASHTALLSESYHRGHVSEWPCTDYSDWGLDVLFRGVTPSGKYQDKASELQYQGGGPTTFHRAGPTTATLCAPKSLHFDISVDTRKTRESPIVWLMFEGL
jgi:hypothetical protein